MMATSPQVARRQAVRAPLGGVWADAGAYPLPGYMGSAMGTPEPPEMAAVERLRERMTA